MVGLGETRGRYTWRGLFDEAVGGSKPWEVVTPPPLSSSPPPPSPPRPPQIGTLTPSWPASHPAWRYSQLVSLALMCEATLEASLRATLEDNTAQGGKAQKRHPRWSQGTWAIKGKSDRAPLHLNRRTGNFRFIVYYTWIWEDDAAARWSPVKMADFWKRPWFGGASLFMEFHRATHEKTVILLRESGALLAFHRHAFCL